MGVNTENNLPKITREFGDQIHFAHVRNIEFAGKKSFCEQVYHDIGFDGSLRPDHGRMIWGETGKIDYDLYNHTLGATYLNRI